MGDLSHDLSSAEAFPGRPRSVTRVETHVSWVFLVDDHAYKVKKPVSLGFLDFSTLAQRQRACAAEVRLNARLAPHVYLGVVPIRRDSDGRHRIDGPGVVVDWAVHMRRMPDADRGDQRLARGTLGPADIDRLAARIAAFHATAPSGPEVAAAGTLEAIAALVRQNFAQTREEITRYLSRAQATEIESWQLGALATRAGAFRRRRETGRIRDGHGDLRLDQLYIADDGEVTILDCIEFDDRFRHEDVCADVAFLVMDLAWHERVDLAELFLARYARYADDYDLYAVADFYESYRAWVRGKISALLARDRDATEAERARAQRAARRYFMLALSAKCPRVQLPRVVAVGGLIASGKSTIADELGELLSAPVVDTDRTRKSLLGVAPTTPLREGAWQGAYDPSFTGRVYAEMLRRAEVVLGSNRSVILDASFRSVDMRSHARTLAKRMGVPFVFVECAAPAAVCHQRLVERSRHPAVSDGRLDVFAAFASRFEPVTELAAQEYRRLDTSRPPAESRTLLNQWFKP
jgi:aminoglycoside phosphotransferase family enzyme/predicted kinase